MKSQWYVYLVRCSDNTLYGGITTDLKRRLSEHNTCNTRGAKYTRVRRPVSLVYSEKCDDRSHASKREYAIKKSPKNKKERLVVEFGSVEK